MIAFEGTAEARATDAGVTAMGLSAEDILTDIIKTVPVPKIS